MTPLGVLFLVAAIGEVPVGRTQLAPKAPTLAGVGPMGARPGSFHPRRHFV
jgi:hypothetical protein